MALIQRLGHTLLPTLDRYVQAVGQMRHLGTYHKYVYWHARVMDHHDHSDPLMRRSVAHRGPAFLPWHREFIWRFEQDLQNAIADYDMGLPYWNWAADKSRANS